MSLITNIAGVPLFSTVQEALTWATANGLSGYHIHNWQGQTGYMGGENHLQATGMPINSNTPPTGGGGTTNGGSMTGGGSY